jgi:DNA primase RepB-like protein/AAA domain-containing protein
VSERKDTRSDVEKFVATLVGVTAQGQLSVSDYLAANYQIDEAAIAEWTATTKATLNTRLNQYREYLQAIFKPGDTVCFVIIEHDASGGRERVAQKFTTLEDALNIETFISLLRANHESSTPGNTSSSVYVAMNAYKPELVGETQGRTQENVIAVRALQADMDDDVNAEGIVALMQTSVKVPPPSIIVESSTGKRQGIWLVDGISKDEAKPLMQVIAAEFKTDSAVAEVARVMRVPGFVNRKPAYIEEPVAKLLSNTGVRYSRDAFKIEAAAVSKFEQRTPPEEYLGAPFIHKGGPYGGMWGHVNKIIGHYMGAKNINDGDVMFAIVREHIEANGCFEKDGTTPFNWNEDVVRRQCHDRVEKWETGEEKNPKLKFSEPATTQPVVQQWPTPPASQQPVSILQGEPRAFDPREYALKDLFGVRFSGWFPRGRITLVAGSSGAMKTTFLTQALKSARDGETFLNHEPGRFPFKFLFADRGEYDCEDTFERMGMSGEIPFRSINEIRTFDAVIAAIVEEAASGEYKALVIDGGDLLIEDNNDGRFVKDFNSYIQQIAKHYGVAFIVTTGANKMSQKALKDGAERRSIVKGSEVWSRMGGTVFTLNSEDDGTGDTRRLVVQHRNSKTERFLLQVQHGRLVAVDEASIIEKSQAETMLDWVLGQESFTSADVRNRFKWNGVTAQERLAGLVKAGVIKMVGKTQRGSQRYEVPSTIKAMERAAWEYEKTRKENTVDLEAGTPKREHEEGLDEGELAAD